jgi:hypothetical protein
MFPSSVNAISGKSSLVFLAHPIGSDSKALIIFFFKDCKPSTNFKASSSAPFFCKTLSILSITLPNSITDISSAASNWVT